MIREDSDIILPCLMAKRVVVVGGGFAGSLISKQLVKHPDLIDLTLIDTKDYFEHIPGVFREILYAGDDWAHRNTDSEYIPSTIIEHSTYLFPRGKLIVGEVVEVSPKNVLVNITRKQGDSIDCHEKVPIEFDFLVVSV